MTPKDFIPLIVNGAVRCETLTGIFSSVTIAQAAIESGWGERAVGNNLFGIKASHGWDGKTRAVVTHEIRNGVSVQETDLFRVYDSWDDSIIDHGKFLTQNHRYAAALKCTTPQSFANALQAAVYSTSPTYASLIISIIRSHQLEQFDHDHRNGTGA